jgi:hypothetical protein
MTRTKSAITAELARELLNYDPTTGVITWASTRRGGAREGDQAGFINKHGYREVFLCGNYAKAHRLVWLIQFGQWPPHGVDHINGNKTDNRLANLRLADPGENLQNRTVQRNNSSGHTGVSWDEGKGLWRAAIYVGKRKKFIGRFKSKEMAAEAYRQAKADLHTFNPTQTW